MRKYFGGERREKKTLHFKRTGVPIPWKGGRDMVVQTRKNDKHFANINVLSSRSFYIFNICLISRVDYSAGFRSTTRPRVQRSISHMSQCMRFSTMWYVRPAKPQISLRIRAV